SRRAISPPTTRRPSRRIPTATRASLPVFRPAAGGSRPSSAVRRSSWPRTRPTTCMERCCRWTAAGWRAEAGGLKGGRRAAKAAGAGSEEEMQYQFDFSALVPYWRDFLSGALVTIEITVFSVIIGLVIGIACAIARRSEIGPLRALVGV